MENKNQNNYDVTKSNFFNDSTIPNSSTPPKQEQQQNNLPQNNQPQNIQPQNSISAQLNYLQSNNYYNPQTPIGNINQFSQFQNYYPNNYNQNLNQFYPQNQNNFNSSNQNIPPRQPETLLQKLENTASNVINLIKKDDPIKNLFEIKKNEYDELLKTSSKIINCQTLKKNRLNNNNVKTIISNPRKINDSIIKQSYLLYDVSTPIFNWFVNRRYSDFVWLRECLLTLFPVEFIPQLPKKKIGNRRFEEDFVEKRKKGLQYFIDGCLNNETLKTAEPLLIFLSCVERGYFDQQMKIFSVKPNIIDIKSIDGKLTVVDITNSLFMGKDVYFGNIQNYFTAQNDVIKQINKNLNNFSANMIEACKNLDEIEKGFEKLTMLSNKVNFSEDYSHVFEQYQIFVKNWKRIQINQSFTMKTKFKEFFKYIKNDTLSMIELFDKEKEINKDYVNLRDNLNNKKEGLWKQMDVTKWELSPMERIDSALLFRDKFYAFSKMCFQETMNLNNKIDLLGYYFYSNYTKFKEICKNLEDYSVKSLTEFSKEIEPSVTDTINVWSNLANNVNVN